MAVKPITSSKLAAQSLTEFAYRRIKEEILASRLSPGALVPIERFVRQMRLSRTPVREAILRLEREGFVEVRPRLGTYVSRLDLGRVQEMYHVRGVLEGAAARLAAAWGDPEEAREVRGFLEGLSVKPPIDTRALSEAGQHLHQLIVDSCGNSVLRETILGLQDHFVRFRHLSLRLPDKVLQSHKEHLAIAGALARRDAEAAEQLVRTHFQHAAKALIESLVDGNQHRTLAGIAI
jgi:DNA-binding GntR family transcriptional regulator